ncbi:AMP-binding protein [Nocardioides rubriscoriae]|uniref:AMP-binding protein n=1 Tax=Nocardioides rubriscoriae TaxID=642762 RepID=UPI0011DF20ED|nr:AMP-binding protein [Nocardioides rubriscoriae]
MLDALTDPTGPDRPALLTLGDAVLSRDGLLEAAGRLSGGLREAGGPVAVHATASVETVVAVVAGLLSGVPVVPVPPDSGPVEREHVLRDSGAAAWVGPAGLGGGLPGVAARAGDPAAYDPDATALVLYTSGTTGLPKGVPHTGRSLAACLDGLAEAWAWTPDDVLVHGLPLFHLHGLVLGLLGPLRVGSPLVHTVRPSPEAYAGATGSVYFGVPTVWHRLVGSPASAHALRRARLLVSGSAPLPVTTFTALESLTGLAPRERYGMTETGITLSARVDEPPRAGWVGRPVGSTQTRLVAADAEGMGRLEVRGPSVMSGYLGRPTPDLDADGWFATGDLAVVDDDGWHRIVGRESTDLIKTGGYRVGAGEVEAVLLEHPAVDEVAVVGVPDDDLGQRIVAYVVGSGSPGLEDELVALVGSRLSWHKRPRAVVMVDALPRNAMGKVQKKTLAEG